MTSRILTSQLASDDRAMAQALWDALLFAPSPPLLEAARRQLKASPYPVQEAIMNALVPLMAHNIEAHREENPFSINS